MAYDDRSVKPMSASLMRARIATKILSGLYEDVPTMLTSARFASWRMESGISPAGVSTMKRASVAVTSMCALACQASRSDCPFAIAARFSRSFLRTRAGYTPVGAPLHGAAAFRREK